jgi:uncharacterized membrane protein
LGRTKRQAINATTDEFNKKFLWLALFFLILDGVMAAICFPVLNSNPECYSMVRLWVVVDIVVMIMLVPNIFYMYKTSIRNEERMVLNLVKQICEEIKCDELPAPTDEERQVMIQQDINEELENA